MAQTVNREPVVTTEGTKFTNNILNSFTGPGEPVKTEKGLSDPDPIESDDDETEQTTGK